MDHNDPDQLFAALLGLQNAHTLLMGSLVKAGVVDAGALLDAMKSLMAHIDFSAIPAAMAEPMLELHRNVQMIQPDPGQGGGAKPQHLRLILGGKSE